MFQRGETVLYGTEGVCRIAEIQEMKIGRTKAEYYVLKPVYRESATIYVPVDNPTLVARMKHVLSQQEIDRLLETVLEGEVPWVEDVNERSTVKFCPAETGACWCAWCGRCICGASSSERRESSFAQATISSCGRRRSSCMTSLRWF